MLREELQEQPRVGGKDEFCVQLGLGPPQVNIGRWRQPVWLLMLARAVV